ncbi:SMI1/KNR4 family protein [Kitasatospora sp. NPDC092286]|uniref:SMI1/KNR4 family protein n=1 Tax=Kitasatospora sp. NPDC092286 TaxID=3364087 RepID=UPI0037F97E7E
MDGLAGTQSPVRRLTDPEEAIAELERVVPGLTALRLPGRKDVNWPALETELGTALPTDYKLLCELYPPFVLSDFLGFGGPVPGFEGTWVQGARESLEIITEWCEEADLAVPYGGHRPTYMIPTVAACTSPPSGSTSRRPSSTSCVCASPVPAGRTNCPVWAGTTASRCRI